VSIFQPVGRSHRSNETPQLSGEGRPVAAPGVSGGTHMKRARVVCLFLLAATLAVGGSAIAGASISPAARSAASPPPGKWTMLGAAPETDSEPTLLHIAQGRDMVLWEIATGPSTSTFKYAQIARYGGLASGVTDMFAGHHWHTLIGDPTLLQYHGSPLLVFSGQRTLDRTDLLSAGCVIGTLDTSAGWKLQSWSLSHDCAGAVGKYGGAAIDRNGMLSAAWAAVGSGAINYRIGVAPTIPPSSLDSTIPITHGNIELVDETNDSADTDHFYAAWYREFSTAPYHDGLYLADLTARSSPRQAPGSGTTMEEDAFESPALASTLSHGGVYAAYCSNTSNCSKILLWRYGAQKAASVPDSSGATVMALSGGPSGRLWVAWYNRSTSKVYTVRTNIADNRFGPVESYAVQGCISDNDARIVISGGPQQRLDVVLVCSQTGNFVPYARTTQSIRGLSLDASTPGINHQTGGSVTYTVTDAGDPLAGVAVSVDGRSAKTSASGRVKFAFSKHTRPGRFKVTATVTDYYGAASELHVY
jgi:hypothetical protein